MTTIIFKLVEMFIMVIIGIVFTRTGLVPKGFNDNISKFIMNVSLPCSTLVAFADGITREIWIQSAQIIIATTALMFFYVLINSFLYKKLPDDEAPVFKFATLTPNTNFLGYPMVTALYGNSGILLLSMAHLPYRVATWTVGIGYFTKDSKDPWYKKILTCLPMWAIILGVLFASLNISLPGPLFNAIDTMGKTNTGLSMYLIGIGLANISFSNYKKLKVWFFCLLRLVIIPALLMLTCKVFNFTGPLAGTLILLGSMPAGTLTVLFTKEFNKDLDIASAIVSLSMILCLITLPIISSICVSFF